MNIYNVNKEMLGVGITFLTIFVIVPLIVPQTDCNEFRETLKHEKCSIKIDSIENFGPFKILGTNPETNEPCECNHYNRWWNFYKDEMKPGDYFIKNEGEAFFKIVKPDTIITHEWKCPSK
ncbi:hypothetical protein [Chryseobacterium gwangjuense]|uniref:hypothetical protein n=1 Tax=Chryseobacterium gwangjuense TaxID=1069980 RepID=UPI001E407FD4|nr:hypothetical protein [Chryseobacterium gwangjuense]MCE3075632.1 hypothetical protein [Chryseobacterium gwangjuense]